MKTFSDLMHEHAKELGVSVTDVKLSPAPEPEDLIGLPVHNVCTDELMNELIGEQKSIDEINDFLQKHGDLFKKLLFGNDED